MNRKRLTLLLIVALLIVWMGSAFASSGAPASQFGVTDWPYRQPTNCGTSQGAVWSSKGCGSKSAESTDKPSSTESEPAPQATAKPTPAATPSPKPATQPKPSTNTGNGSNGCASQQQSTCPTKPATTAKPSTSNGSNGCASQQQSTCPNKPAESTKPGTIPDATATLKPSTGGDYTTGSVAAQEAIAYQLLNEDRSANGRNSLTLDPVLSSLARMKSCDMNANKYFAHQSPTLGSAADMLRNNGYIFKSVGENIAHHATVTKAQAAFMSSTGHRTNILGSQWTRVGIGVCYDAQGFVYVTQLFAR